MNILIHVFSWPPANFSGADMMLYRLMQRMPKHTFKVQIDRYMKPTTNLQLPELYEWADCIWTHLIVSSPITAYARLHGKPVFNFVHNGNISTLPQNEPHNYMVFNSECLQRTTRMQHESIVVNPPVYAEEYERRTGQYVTMVNLTTQKGYGEFLHCANCFQHLKFMGVEGGYNTQMRQQSVWKNIHFKPHLPSLQPYLKDTGVLLVPSKNESWSLCASEAQACGIPVIAADLPGIRENLGDTALYGNYAANLRALYESHELYEKYVNLGLQNTAMKQEKQEKQLLQLDNFIKEKVELAPKKEKKVIYKPSTNGTGRFKKDSQVSKDIR